MLLNKGLYFNEEPVNNSECRHCYFYNLDDRECPRSHEGAQALLCTSGKRNKIYKYCNYMTMIKELLLEEVPK